MTYAPSREWITPAINPAAVAKSTTDLIAAQYAADEWSGLAELNGR